MNHLRNGSVAVGAPGSIMRARAEAEGIVRGILKHDDALVASVVRSFFDLYLQARRDEVVFVHCATEDAGIKAEAALNLFYAFQREEALQ